MSRLEIVKESVIYRNPNPGYQAVSAANTSPVQLSENELVCSYNRGQAYYAVDLTLHLARSLDGGYSWSQQSLIYDGTPQKYSYHAPFASRISDGRIVLFGFRTDRSDPDRPLFNETTGGIAHIDNFLMFSDDNGESWSEPQILSRLEGCVITPCSPLIELPGGEWMLHFDRWHEFDDPGPYRPKSVLLFSSDQGESWSTPTLFGDGQSEGKGFWHGRIITLHDGRLFTMFWSADNKTRENLTLHRCFGSPDGRTWSTPEATNIPGQTNWPVDLREGRMAAIYTRRESDNPGLFVTLSEDEGKTWDLENQVCVWDATGRDKLGVVSLESYPRSHDTIAFGAPHAMRLMNGNILVSFWCTEMSITHVRSAILKVV